MRRSYLILLFIIVFAFSCDKNNTEAALDSYIIVGDIETTISVFNDTTLYLPDMWDGIFFQIDLDSDSIYDFGFYGSYLSSQCFYSSIIRIDCLSEQNKIICNDSIKIPQILDYGDTLSFTGKWMSQKFEISGISFLCSAGGGDGIIHKYGIWRGISEKYMGLMIEKEEYVILGWIKLSVPDTEWVSSITLHAIGYKKAAYNIVYTSLPLLLN